MHGIISLHQKFKSLLVKYFSI